MAQGTYEERKQPTVGYWQFHSNGAGFGALVVGVPLTARSAFGFETLNPFRFAIRDEDLVINLAQIIDALVEHAVDRSGASGLGVVRAGIEARDDIASPMPSLLVHQRGDFPFIDRYEGQPGVAEIPTSDHTVDLDAIRGSSTELLLATRAVATDLMQAML